MLNNLIIEGRLHSPFSIFIRKPHSYSDETLLEIFGLDDYRRSAPTKLQRHAIIADAGDWSMISDDWGYTLNSRKTTWATIEKIAKRLDVFACTEGDCDRSFDYTYHAGGKLLRAYAVDSPRFTDRLVSKDFGPPLPGERELLSKDGEWIGMAVAASLGVLTNFTNNDLRVYAPRMDLDGATNA